MIRTLTFFLASSVSLSYTRPAYYQFGYQVDTLDTGDYHGHMEELDGVTKRGEFKVRLPDGRLQVTSYQADERGFRPKVSYEIDPLFVAPPPEIPFVPEKKLIRRPPPKDYSAPEFKYLPPTINYDPRGGHSVAAPASPALLTPAVSYKEPSETYLPPPSPKKIPSTPQPPSLSYSAPKLNYNARPEYPEFTPLINYKPRSHYLPPSPESLHQNYLSPNYYSNERQDNAEAEISPPLDDSQQHYYLVPVRASSGSKPVLALLVKKRQNH